ncbi:uncharacterized protein LOC133906034 [Phragmites australis]|uniref:uncharacterized protein LOC133906034 n=1 Tax=Phragmites australis TaxID=29695 RepID=UPI002D79A188|nr:uncharacterized protein LOC133906034 [Phragmites australis]
MAGGGWIPRELSLATAAAPGTSAGAGEGRRLRGLSGQRAHRRTVSSLYAELGALLHNLPPTRPASREEIVDAAVAQVKVLEDTAAVLEAWRAVREPRAAEVAVSGATVCFSARLPAPRAGALTRVLEAFHRRGVEVLVATMARHGGGAVVTVTAAATAPEVLEMVRADIARID